MQSKRYKRKTAYALSRQLRRRFYVAAAIATTSYVLLSLVKFHAQISYLAQELSIIWAISLLCYTSFREVLRWNDVNDSREHHGEIWAGLVLIGAIWMVVWNLLRVWVFHLSAFSFPEDYLAATGETIVLYTLSSLSSFLYQYRKSSPKKYKTVRKQPRPVAVATENEPVDKPMKIPEISVVLTKSSTLEDKKEQNKNA